MLDLWKGVTDNNTLHLRASLTTFPDSPQFYRSLLDHLWTNARGQFCSNASDCSGLEHIVLIPAN